MSWNRVAALIIASCLINLKFIVCECLLGAQYDDHVLIRFAVNNLQNGAQFSPSTLSAHHLMLGDEDVKPVFAQHILDMCKDETKVVTIGAWEVLTNLNTLPKISILANKTDQLELEMTLLHITTRLEHKIFEYMDAGDEQSTLDMIDDGVGVSARDQWESTPLMVAIQLKQTRVIAVLLNLRKSQLQINSVKSSGHSALFYAVKSQDTQLVRFLLMSGADPNLSLLEPASLGNTPLHLACMLESIEIVRELVKHGADSTLRNKDGLTARDFLPTHSYAWNRITRLLEEDL